MSVRSILFIFWAVFSFQCLYAQENSYIKVPSAFARDWSEFETAGENGLPNEQLAILDRIIALSVQQKNAPELYRAFAQYGQTMTQTMQEPEDKHRILERFEAMPATLQAPLSNIVHAFLAEQYQQYNVWNISPWGEDFSIPVVIDGKTVYFTKDQDAQKAVKRYHYLESLKNPEALFQQRSMDYANSLMTYDSTFFLKSPTLYDLLADQAIGYLILEERNFNFKPDIQLYGATEDFTKNYSNDILKIFSQQESFHWKNGNLTAYTDHVLMRLQYVRGINKDKDNARFLFALQKLKARLNNNPAVLGVICREAETLLADPANHYHWIDNPGAKDKNSEVHAMVASALQQYASSAYAQEAKSLIQGIEARRISFQFGQTLIPGRANIMTVDYKNVQSAFLTVYHIDQDNKSTEFSWEDNVLRGAKHKVHSQQLVLDMNGKFNSHSKDFIIPALKETGMYLFLITSTADSADLVLKLENLENVNVAYALMELHAISVLHHNAQDGVGVIVLDQLTGKPVAGASVYASADAYKSSYKLLGKTNQAGELKSTLTTGNSLMVTYKNDSITEYMYPYYNYDNQNESPVSYRLITDRNIYRPGQTVHFKVYAFEGKSNTFKAMPKHEAELSFMDYEGVSLGSVSGYTNEFGTFAGSFVLPRTGKTGAVSMNINGSFYAGNFSVEEYKRPSFEVEAKYDKTAYKLGDKVTISGKVKAYSGYGLGDSKVHVRVSYSYGYRFYYSSEPLLDTVIMSNASGDFSLSFIAKTKGEDNFGASFSYDIAATSVAGETQRVSGSTFIGKFRPEWEVTVPAQVLSNQMTYARIGVSQELTLAPNTAKPKIEVELWKSNPDYVQAESFFTAHEFQSFTPAQFKSQFKNAQYGPALPTKINPLTGAIEVTLPKEDIPAFVKVRTFTVTSGDSILLNKEVNNQPGRYELHLSCVIGADTLESVIHNFVLIRMDSKKKQHKEPLWIAASTKSFKPGDEVQVVVGTQYKKQNVLVEVYRGPELLSHQWYKVKGRVNINYKVKPEDLGGINIHAFTLHDGNFSQVSTYINIPFTTKELAVKLETARTILRPGAQEKWTVSVASKDGSPLSSELAVGMADASLDQFADNQWHVAMYQDNYSYPRWEISEQEYPYFSVLGIWDGRNEQYWNMNGTYRGDHTVNRTQSMGAVDEMTTLNANAATYGFTVPAQETARGEGNGEGRNMDAKTEDKKPEKVRSNFSEMAFFYPQLTAQDNRFQFEFTLPDALTSWKFQALAHDKLMRLGYTTEEFTAQKELMVDPNEPRFFRAGDEFIFTASLANLTDKEQNVTATLEWFDPYTNIVIPNILGIMSDQQAKLPAKGGQTVSWTLKVPKAGLDLIAYRIRVSSGGFSDAEEKVIPVLSNRTQVIESVPVTVEGKGNYVFELPKLLRQASPTQRNERLVVEYNANPLWSAVMAIPYLTEYPYDCAEQVFSKLFANSISQQIVNVNPQIQKVLSQPGTNTPDLFLSALKTNEDLKAIVLAETPWVLEASSESQQKQKIAQLFDMNNLMQQEMSNLSKLNEMQHPNGGWSWFAGGIPNIYITQHILSGFGHLSSLGIDMSERIDYRKSLEFLDRQYEKQYRALKKDQVQRLEGLTALEVQWLYAKEMLGQDTSAAAEYYAKCLQRDWIKFPLHIQAMAGTYFIHAGQPEMAQKILKSIQNRATTRKALGTYWNENTNTYAWERNAIETQASLIEFFKKSGADEKTLASMKLWLLNQKRGQYWESTKATAWACYSLLIDAKPVLESKMTERIFVGNQQLTGSAAGYVRNTYTASEIQPSMGRMTVEQSAEEPGFGSLNLVYTEEIDKLAKNASGMQIDKQLFLVRDGKETPVTATTKLVLGDLIRVHLQLTSDRALEFVHVKDLRASGTENVEVLSAYRSSGNLYYYNVNRDASTEFFLDRLPKGKHTITYDMRISGRGAQSTGYAFVECLYAPEFRANSASGTLKVE